MDRVLRVLTFSGVFYLFSNILGLGPQVHHLFAIYLPLSPASRSHFSASGGSDVA